MTAQFHERRKPLTCANTTRIPLVDYRLHTRKDTTRGEE
ncbi:Uncharacterised protein [Mycobacteroides abscessus subsp. abscessus]|nr:Uncharacterised protein [Mycobacteroides abscessus subsp. abscessus]